MAMFVMKKRGHTRLGQYASRIPKIYFIKSKQIGRGRAVLASTADSAHFW